ncbi:MAG: hypothetical protein AAFV53_28050 [Myxococcota bacterium]
MLLSLLMLATPAQALDCVDYELQGSMPAHESTDLPINARMVLKIYAWSTDDMTVRMVEDVSGDDVATSIETFDEATQAFLIVTPDADLSPSTAYRVEILRDDAVEDIVRFTTGTGADETAPSDPSVLDTDFQSQTDEWGDWNTFSVDIDPSTDERTAVMYRIEIGDETFSAPLVRYALSAQARMSDDPCNSDEAGNSDPAAVWVQVSAIDAAGNVSGSDVYEPEEETGGGEDSGDPGDSGDPVGSGDDDSEDGDSADGCAVVSAPAAMSLVMMGLLAAGTRRRRSEG